MLPFSSASGRLPVSAACAEPSPPIGARAGEAALSHAQRRSAPARCAAFSRVLSRPAGLSLQQRPEYRVRSCGGASHGECLVAGRPAGPVRPAAHGALGLAGQQSTQCPASARGSAEAGPARPFSHHGFLHARVRQAFGAGGGNPHAHAQAHLPWQGFRGCVLCWRKSMFQAQKLTPLPGYLNLKEKKIKEMFDLGIDQGCDC